MSRQRYFALITWLALAVVGIHNARAAETGEHEGGYHWMIAVPGFLAAGACMAWAVRLRRNMQQQTELIRQQLKREAAFASLGRRLTAATKLEVAAQTVVDIADELIGWDACYVRLYTTGNLRSVPVLYYDIVNGQRSKTEGPDIREDLSERDRQVVERGAELVLRQSPAEPVSGVVPFGDQTRRSASLIYVPMRNGPNVVGVLSIQSYALNRYGQEDLRLLQNLADLSAATLDRIQTESALKESESRFRMLFESSPLGIAVSRQSRLLYANAAHQQMFGCADFSELKGKSFLELVAPREREAVLDRLARRTGDDWTLDRYETVGLRKDGSEFYYHVDVARMRLDDGDGMVAFLTDITERKRAEDQLRESEERFARVFRATPVPVSVINAETGKFLDVNDAFLRLFQFRREQVIGSTALELNIWEHPADRLRTMEWLERHRSLRDYEARFRTTSGEICNTLISVEPIQISQQECLLFITHDVTERLNLESQLRHSQKMDAIGQLAAGVAHDFNNILTVIQGHVSLMQAASRFNPEMTDSLTQVSTAADRAASLTRQLLTFSRKQVMQPRSLDLREVVSQSVRMLQRLMGENITVIFNPNGELPAIHADSGMMEQIIVNLAVNARDAMPQGGKLTIDLGPVTITAPEQHENPEARAGEFVCLRVADTGFGMDASIRARIFEPFFTTKETGKGTGLGLATVYGIVKQHRGWIDVLTKPGEGSTFKVYLPVTTPLPVTTAGTALPAKVEGGCETILVVEDEKPLRNLVIHILRRHGYRVLEAEHGPEALRVWEKEGPSIDLLLTDMVMPEGMSGWELARDLTARKPGLKVIYTSGYSAELFGENCYLREGVNFLPKPYQPRVLTKAVRESLDGISQKGLLQG